MAWVAKDGWRRFRSAVIAVALLQALGVLCAMAFFGGLLLYLRQVEAGTAPRIPGIRFQEGFEQAGFPLVLLAAGLLSAASLFAAECRLQALTRSHERFCLQRLLRIMADPYCRGWQDFVGPDRRRSLARLSRIGVRWTAFAFRDLVRLTLPVCAIVLGIFWLLHIDSALTLAMMPLPLLYLVPLYRINRSVSDCQRRFAASNDRARRGISLLLRRLSDASMPTASKTRWAFRGLEGTDYERAMDCYYDRMLAPTRMRLVNNAFLALGLFALLLYFGLDDRGSAKWVDLAAYLAALRITVMGLRRCADILVNLSRFHPEFASYHHLIQGAAELKSKRLDRDGSADLSPPALRLRNRSASPLSGSSDPLELFRGRPFWILTPNPPTQTDLEAIASRIEDSLEPSVQLAASALCAGKPPADLHGDLIEYSLGPEASSERNRQLVRGLALLGLDGEARSLPDGLRTDMEEVRRASPELLFALSVAPSLCRQPPWAFLAARALLGLEEGVIRRLFDVQSMGFVGLASNRVEDFSKSLFQDLPEGGAIVLDRNLRIRAWGTRQWIHSSEERLEKWLQQQRRSGSAPSPDSGEEGDPACGRIFTYPSGREDVALRAGL